MNIQESAIEYLRLMMKTRPFEQVSQVVEYRFVNPSHHWLLPLHVCRAFGGNELQAVPAMAALIACQTAILLVDDLLDNDGRREILGLSVGESANLAMLFQSLGIECMSKSLSTSGRQIQIVGHINQMIMETAYGQHLDTKSPDTEQAYWEIAHAKSCPFFGLSFYLGAIAGGATLNKADAIMKLGRLYGEIIQIHDDLNDCLSTTIGSDWLQKKSTLPILFARITDHPERRKFMALMEKNINDNDLHEAQEILIRSGALSFCVDQIVQRHRAGQLLMAELNLPDSVPLVQIFDGVILPIWNLLETQD